MAYRVNPDLTGELAAFGGETANKCFNCGNCTAVCALSKGNTVFPRKIIRFLQLGLDRRLEESPEPWMCYYCGTCSDTCPREAEPGELMMAMRRWLTARYDWTGLSKRLYERLARRGAALALGLAEIARGAGVPLQVNAHGSVLTPFFTSSPVRDYRSALRSNALQYAAFFRGMLARHVYIPPSPFEAWFLSAAHDDLQIARTLRAARAAMDEAADAA